MVKRVLVMLLTVIMVIGIIPANIIIKAASTDSNYAVKVIEALGIMKTDAPKKTGASDTVTRAEFAQMLINLSVYKDTVNSAGNMTVFNDVKKSFEGAGYIQFAVSHDWMSGYINGNFKPNQAITLQEAVDGVIHLLGYTDNDFTGNREASKMSLYATKKLDKNITKTKKQALARIDCINLFYNTLKATMKDNTVYATKLGYTINADGDVEYLSIISGEMEGPVIADTNWDRVIPLEAETATYYRNDSLSNQKSIQYRDVLYYSKKLNTVWAYSERATGELKEVLPNRLNPTEIILGGNTFEIGSQEMSYRFSTLGDLEVGDIISVLLGKEGTIVGVLTEEEHYASIKGILLDYKESVSKGKDSTLYKTIAATILDSYGRKNLVEAVNIKDTFAKNDIVEVEYIDGKANVKSIATDRFAQPLSGTVNETATRLGTYAIARDIRIIDLKGDEYMYVTASRLAGVLMYQSDILYHSFNSNGEIQELILNNMTKDLYSYGILTGSNLEMIQNAAVATYTYMHDGEEKTSTTKDFTDMLPSGPSRFDFVNNNLEEIVRLNGVAVAAIDGLEVKSTAESYIMADEVAVYYLNDSKYYNTTLSNVDDLNKFNLTAYYDRTMQLGGRIRVIIAQDK